MSLLHWRCFWSYFPRAKLLGPVSRFRLVATQQHLVHLFFWAETTRNAIEGVTTRAMSCLCKTIASPVEAFITSHRNWVGPFIFFTHHWNVMLASKRWFRWFKFGFYSFVCLLLFCFFSFVFFTGFRHFFLVYSGFSISFAFSFVFFFCFSSFTFFLDFYLFLSQVSLDYLCFFHGFNQFSLCFVVSFVVSFFCFCFLCFLFVFLCFSLVFVDFHRFVFVQYIFFSTDSTFFIHV